MRRKKKEQVDKQMLTEVNNLWLLNYENSLERSSSKLIKPPFKVVHSSEEPSLIVSEDESFSTIAPKRDTINEELSRNRSIGRSIKRLFSKRGRNGGGKQIKEEHPEVQEDIDDFEIPRGLVDPLPNFKFSSLNLTRTAAGSSAGPGFTSQSDVFYPAFFNLIKYLGPGVPIATEFEVIEKGTVGRNTNLDTLWNVWIETAAKQSPEDELFHIHWGIKRKLWKKRHVSRINFQYSEFILKDILEKDHVIHIFRFGIRPTKDPLCKQGCRLIIPVPVADSEQMWKFTNELILYDRLALCQFKENVFGITWKRARKDLSKEGFTMCFWIKMADCNKQKLEVITAEILVLYPDNLKPIFTFIKYHDNTSHVGDFVRVE